MNGCPTSGFVWMQAFFINRCRYPVGLPGESNPSVNDLFVKIGKTDGGGSGVKKDV